MIILVHSSTSFLLRRLKFIRVHFGGNFLIVISSIKCSRLLSGSGMMSVCVLLTRLAYYKVRAFMIPFDELLSQDHLFWPFMIGNKF